MLGSATRPTRLATGHCPVASRVVGTGHCPVASPGRRLEPLVFPSELLELSAELKLVGGRRTWIGGVAIATMIGGAYWGVTGLRIELVTRGNL